MGTVTLTGQDTLTLYNRVFTDFADGDVSSITFPNDLVSLKTGKNTNSIFSKNATGVNADLTLRLVRGSGDDIFMQSILTQQERDFASSVIATGEFVKRLGDGQGNVLRDVYTLLGGMITKFIESKDNTEGDTSQAVSIYMMKFVKAPRSIQ